MPSSNLLPYPAQLPQDYYSKNLPAPQAVAPVEVTPTPPPIVPDAVPHFGGAYYGDVPPANPHYGWLWANRKGYLFMYQEPGVWIQVGTNW